MPWHASRKGVALRSRPRPGWEDLLFSAETGGAQPAPPAGLRPSEAPARSLAVSVVTSYGLQTVLRAPGAREVLYFTPLCSVVCSPGPGCVPAVQSGASASRRRRRRRHGVPGHCGECASARAAAGAPPGLGRGSGQPGRLGSRGSCCPSWGSAAVTVPCSSLTRHPSSARPPSARGREENIVHVTRKRDFVDPCVSGAGPRVLAWDWTQQASGFGMVGPQRSVREGVCVGVGGGGGKDFLRILPQVRFHVIL